MNLRSELFASTLLEGLYSDRRRNRSSGDDLAESVSANAQQTEAENLREKRLREDSLAIVYDSRLVQCRRCSAKIKLSLKSAWDPCHWTKHRSRCLRRPDHIIQELKEENDKVSSLSSPSSKSHSLTTIWLLALRIPSSSIC